MKILIIRKDALAQLPPLLSAANILSDLGHQVHIVSSEFSPSIQTLLQSKGITYEVLNHSGNTSFLGKVIQYLYYRYSAKSLLKRRDFDILWVEGGHTIMALGNEILKNKFVLQISELYDIDRRIIKSIRKVIDKAQVVFMPEYNRSVLYQIWFHLRNRPIVLPNKPYFIPTHEELSQISDKYDSVFSAINNKKVILYQGYINPQRKLDNFIAAAKELGEEWIFVVMGRDDEDMIKKYKQINPNIVHIEFIPAPDYLCITQQAHIGILSYDPRLHNTAFCAPNKIYEYGTFGIPMIGNDIPGLKLLEYNKAGVLVDDSNIGTILNAYLKLDSMYDEYSQNAKNLADSTDNKRIIDIAISSINLN